MIETRQLQLASVEVRSAPELIVEGRIVPYGERASSIPEIFDNGSVRLPDRSVAVTLDHAPGTMARVGRVLAIEHRQDGAHATMQLIDTPQGREVYERLRLRVVEGLSVGFIPVQSQAIDGVIHRQRVELDHVGIVPSPEYESAQVAHTRSAEQENQPMSDETTETTEIETRAAVDPRVDDLQERVDRFGSVIDRLVDATSTIETRDRAAAPVTPADWFRAEVAALQGDLEPRRELHQRALADVTGTYAADGTTITDAGGLLAETYLPSQLVHVLDAARPLFARSGSFPMPRSGIARIPVVTQNTQVAKRNTQKSEAASRALIVQARTFEAEWYAGAVDVALEIVASAEPEIQGMIFEDLAGQYARQTEAAAVSAALAIATATGAVLDVSSYAALAKQIATESIVIRKATGQPASLVAVPEDLWPDVVAMVDATDRRQFATSGVSNSDASATLTAEQITLPGGVTLFAYEGADALITNGAAMRVADGGPSRIQAPTFCISSAFIPRVVKAAVPMMKSRLILKAYFAVGADILSMTSLKLNDAAFWRGGNSLNVDKNLPTYSFPPIIRNTRSSIQS